MTIYTKEVNIDDEFLVKEDFVNMSICYIKGQKLKVIPFPSGKEFIKEKCRVNIIGSKAEWTITKQALLANCELISTIKIEYIIKKEIPAVKRLNQKDFLTALNNC